MPQGPDGNTIIIVKKGGGHAGHHGGAWKVAYADFVTSMMALFMVLWLVNTASVVTRERIASYFKKPGVFDKGSGTPLEIGQSGILQDSYAPPASGNSKVSTDKLIYSIDSNKGLRTEGVSGGDKNALDQSQDRKQHDGLNDKQKELGESEKEEFERVAGELKESLGGEGGKAEESLGEFNVKVDEIGLHIEIMDTPIASMFALGSDIILPEAQLQLRKIAEMLKQLPNGIEIEGHTDARPYRSTGLNGRDNWSLSASRANAARHVLEQAGISEKQILSVIGYADRKLKVEDNPFADSNRRISISMRYSNEAVLMLKDKPGVSRKDLAKEETKTPPKVEPTKAQEISNASVSSEASSSTADNVVIEAGQFKDAPVKFSSSSAASSVSQSTDGVNSVENADKIDVTKSETQKAGDKKSEAKTNGKLTPKAGENGKQKGESTGAEPKNEKAPDLNGAPQMTTPPPPTPTEKLSGLVGPKKDLWQQKNFIFGDKNPFDK